MSWKKSELTPLEARKQLLLVESELNRVRLINEVRDFKNEIHRLKHQVSEVGSMASLAAKLGAAFSSVGRAFSRCNDSDKTSWISKLAAVAKFGTSLWLLFRSSRRKA